MCIFGLTGGMGRAPSVTPFMFCFRTFPTNPSPFQSLLPISGTWGGPPLSPIELDNWQEHTTIFPVLSEAPDQLIWPHSSSGRFSIKSLDLKLVQGRRAHCFKVIWRAQIPPKINIFLGQAVRLPLLASDQIIKISGPYWLFSLWRERTHITHFFNCDLARLGWSCVRS